MNEWLLSVCCTLSLVASLPEPPRGATESPLAISSVAAPPASVGPATSSMLVATQESEKEIKGLLQDQANAWNQKDLEGFMKGYWKSDQLTFNSGGNLTRGWEATWKRYQKRYQSGGAEMGQLKFDGLEVHILGKQAAYVLGNWHLTFKESEAGGNFTLIVRKQGEQWQVVHDHTSSVTEQKQD